MFLGFFFSPSRPFYSKKGVLGAKETNSRYSKSNLRNRIPEAVLLVEFLKVGNMIRKRIALVFIFVNHISRVCLHQNAKNYFDLPISRQIEINDFLPTRMLKEVMSRPNT